MDFPKGKGKEKRTRGKKKGEKKRGKKKRKEKKSHGVDGALCESVLSLPPEAEAATVHIYLYIHPVHPSIPYSPAYLRTDLL